MRPPEALHALLDRAEARGWAGADPYDGLLSNLGRVVTPFGFLARFAVSQSVLRSRALRALARPPHSVNPKALGLWLGALAKGKDALPPHRVRELAAKLLHEIESRGTITSPGSLGWGYPFPWQSRSFWAPAGTPNAVVTATIAWHLFEYADAMHDARSRELGLSAARFLETALNMTPTTDGLAISYTANDQTKVVNVSALAARVVARANQWQRSEDLSQVVDRLTSFVLAAQREDGSWPYSLDPAGGWEDSFHTGYVLEALLDLRRFGAKVSSEALTRGFAAYERFFMHDGAARLTPAFGAPLDAHSAAQGILTYGALARSSQLSAKMRDRGRVMAIRVAGWSLEHLWVNDRGCFAYRIQKGSRDEREFARWVEAWMALAMASVGAPGLGQEEPEREEAGVA